MLLQREAQETVQVERCISLRSQRRLPEGGEDEELSSEEVEVSEVKRGTGLGKVVTR